MNITVESGKSKKLLTGGKYCPEDITVTAEAPVAVEEKDVNFYDYDGTCLYAYTIAEAQALTELPPGPTHEGLVFQEWNWTLDEIHAQNTVIDVGALYVTEDGKTRLYIKLEHTASLTVPLNIIQTVSNGVSIDWGDGTAPETVSGTSSASTTHSYANTGDYVITLDAQSGTVTAGAGSSNRLFGNQGNHLAILQGIKCGTGFLGFSGGALQGQAQLKTIAISSYVTGIATDAIHDCFSLQCLVLPRVSVLDSYSLYNCASLRTICTSAKQNNCGGHSCFYDCRSLRRLVISTSSSGDIYASSAQGCFALQSFVIGEGATALFGSCLRGCKSLTSLVIPSKIKSIGGNAFNGCTSLLKIRFAPTTPPTVENANAFTGIPATCIVEVPADSLEAYQNATNYSGIAAQMIGV